MFEIKMSKQLLKMKNAKTFYLELQKIIFNSEIPGQ